MPVDRVADGRTGIDTSASASPMSGPGAAVHRLIERAPRGRSPARPVTM
jgi:hypothetical protein